MILYNRQPPFSFAGGEILQQKFFAGFRRQRRSVL
jgi:hypothetical protein